ncbi:hypothetical protein WKK05_39865 (plasmid) [Nostoc sp. UHCC 0302]|uniref:hypothetical protein n=1 Tax=Nostoc sp. UHCC 0302 TaxID=3134896 RepID=UPI00311CBDBC
MSQAITKFKIEANDDSEPSYELGWDFLTTDLNKDAGGKFIYFGYQSIDGQPPITSVDVKSYDSAQSNPPQGWSWDSTDLNQGAGGKHIYLLWKTGESNKPAIINVQVIAGDQSSPPNIPGWIAIPQDINEGSGGAYIWLYYSTTVPIVKSPPKWRFRFHTLEVIKAQEQSGLSNGDEPYFIFFGVRSTFQVPGSTKVFWHQFINDSWASGIDTRDKATIPKDMGELIFPDVKLLSEADIFDNNKAPEIIGFLGVCLESDNTRAKDIINLMSKLEQAIFDEFKKMIEDGKFDITDPAKAINEATQHIQKALELSLADKLTLFLIAIGDPDDFIGFNSKFYVAGDSSVKKFLSEFDVPVECLEDNRNLELKFEGDGANYKVLWKSHALT